MKLKWKYLVAYTEFFKANRTFTAVGRNSFQPELWELLNKCLNSFSLYLQSFSET